MADDFFRFIAFSSEVAAGSREENASKQKTRAIEELSRPSKCPHETSRQDLAATTDDMKDRPRRTTAGGYGASAELKTEATLGL
jgi:hypothetical protein